MVLKNKKMNIESSSLNIALLEYLIQHLISNRKVCRESSYANYSFLSFLKLVVSVCFKISQAY